MKIEFDSMEKTCLPRFYGGEGEMIAKLFNDGANKILKGTLAPGSNIGMHIHDNSSEIILVLSGEGTVLCDGMTESIGPGECHYCPKGSMHSLRNDSNVDLVFFAVVPVQKDC